MTDAEHPPPLALAGVSRVVAEPLRFKARLAIGENAYASLRMINRTREIWDVVGAAGAGAALLKSGVLGIGAASTPIGWVALAAMASGGACYGLYRWMGDTKGSRVIEIPKFPNTPLDTLGLALFDLIAPLALRLAMVDGAIEPAERAALVSHLVDDWGLDTAFVAQAIDRIEPGVYAGSVQEMATELSAFLHANPDCNHAAIAADLGQFLRRLLEAGGPLSAAEEEALVASVELLQREPEGALAKAWLTAKAGADKAAEQLGHTARGAAEWTRERLPSAEDLQSATGSVANKAWHGARDAAGWTREHLPSPDALRAATSAAASQVEQAAQQAATWAKDKTPVAASQVQDAAKRSVDLARSGLDRLKKRAGR